MQYLEVRFAVYTEKRALSSHKYFRCSLSSTLKLREIQKYGEYRGYFDSKDTSWRYLHVLLHSLSPIPPVSSDVFTSVKRTVRV